MLLALFDLRPGLLRLELVKNRVYVPVRLMDLFTALRARQYNLPTRKYQQHDFGVLHFEDEPWEKFRLVVAPCELFLSLFERL